MHLTNRRRLAAGAADDRPSKACPGEDPFASAVAQQLGLTPPAARSALDPLAVPTHVGGAVAAHPDAFAWLDGRLRSAPAPSNSGAF
jgi:hypothetical protein